MTRGEEPDAAAVKKPGFIDGIPSFRVTPFKWINYCLGNLFDLWKMGQ
jgi:hypothetical protein